MSMNPQSHMSILSAVIIYCHLVASGLMVPHRSNETPCFLLPVLSGSQRFVEKGGGTAALDAQRHSRIFAFLHFRILHCDMRYIIIFPPLPCLAICKRDRWPWEERRVVTRRPVNVAPRPRPGDFDVDPEIQKSREIGPATVVILGRSKAAFIPFSCGHWASECVGKSLAYQEMRMAVCLLVQTFDMRGYDPELWEQTWRILGLWPPTHVPIDPCRWVQGTADDLKRPQTRCILRVHVSMRKL
ncbi:hypothetical protein FIBSPDRAFT_897342 [Athelia psychrophila]|uniref:Cytochrome P450 n=1 Tax=Athelia psychrophila TaxID=1759441 RepID=A0A166CE99_9AGAM|nr:hypothetical protein FIBSPDRAFT_897342 [Fibularhizoctonia sp. CBS 109695]